MVAWLCATAIQRNEVIAMGNAHWIGLQNLVLVAGHAIYVAPSFDHVADDNNWFLQDYQKGEPPFYIEHIRSGVELAADDPKSLLVFSGGQTRYEAGPKSEAQSYWMIADQLNWWWYTNVKLRATTEEFARDSFENLLFGICRFREAVGNYPQEVKVVSWAFKGKRFELHRRAICFPKSSFVFKGVNNPVDLAKAEQGELKAIADFKQDPYGTRQNNKGEKGKNGKPIKYLGDKRDDRNPFNRQHPYNMSCEEVRDLLQHQGPEWYDGPVPWPKGYESA